MSQCLETGLSSRTDVRDLRFLPAVEMTEWPAEKMLSALRHSLSREKRLGLNSIKARCVINGAASLALLADIVSLKEDIGPRCRGGLRAGYPSHKSSTGRRTLRWRPAPYRPTLTRVSVSLDSRRRARFHTIRSPSFLCRVHRSGRSRVSLFPPRPETEDLLEY